MTFTQKLAISYTRAKFKILSSLSKKKAAEKAFELFCTPQFRNRKDLPPVFRVAEKITFVFREFRITGYRWNKGAGTRALIVHGFESSVVNFERYVQMLVKRNYEVLAFDAPAHGRSSGRQINAIIYRDLIKHVCTVYGPVERFIAHSLGGLVTCMCLAEIRHNAQCRLVLIAPATETSTAINQFFGFLEISDNQVRKEFEKIITRLSAQPVSWFSIPRALRKIKASILWCHDQDDKTTPLADVLKVQARNHANIEFYITKGLGHRRIYRDAGVGRKIADFI